MNPQPEQWEISAKGRRLIVLLFFGYGTLLICLGIVIGWQLRGLVP